MQSQRPNVIGVSQRGAASSQDHLSRANGSGKCWMSTVQDVVHRGHPWTSVDGYALCSSFSTQASQLLIPSRDEAWEKPTGPGHTMGTSPKKSCMIEETCGEIDKFVVRNNPAVTILRYICRILVFGLQHAAFS